MRISAGIPEELCRIAKQLLEEEEIIEDEKNTRDVNFEKLQNENLCFATKMLNYAQFLFKVANTKNEYELAFKTLNKWIQLNYNYAENKENAKYDICRTLEKMAVDLTIKTLPKSCSIKYGFPLTLPDTEETNLHEIVKIETSARIDLSGGWTDTPPITYDMDFPAVLNVAVSIDGEKPISVVIKRLELMSGIWIQTGEGTLRCFETISEIIENANKPNEAGSIICAGIIVSGVFENLIFKQTKESEDIPIIQRFDYKNDKTTGLSINCRSKLPHGSGMGTSSILSGALLACLWKIFEKKFDENDLIKGVLKIEQYHTTKGGWQDQIGGLIPGIKLGTLSHDEEKNVTWKNIEISEELENEINSKLVLMYTGKTRLAKNLLETVILNWIKGELEIMLAFKELTSNTQSAVKKLKSGLFPCEEITKYHELKNKVAADSEPFFVKNFIEKFKEEKLIKTGCFGGAGGGGFLYVYLEDGKTIEDFKKSVEKLKIDYPHVFVCSTKIDNEPLKITVYGNN